jgi:putative ABC transport system permease protein
LQGRRLLGSDKRAAMVGFVLAANLGKKVGDEIELYDQPFVIAGIFESPTTFENGGVIVLLSELQELMNLPNEVSGFAVAAEHPIDERGIADLRQRIEAAAPGIEATTVGSFVDSLREVRISRAVAWLTSAIAIIIGGIGMLNTMTMSVAERTKEIGMLRAIGWRRARVVQMILGESIMLSMAGALVGSAGGNAERIRLARWKYQPDGCLPRIPGCVRGRRRGRTFPSHLEREFAPHRSAATLIDRLDREMAENKA